MKTLRGLTDSDVQQVLDILKGSLRFQITKSQIAAAVAEVSSITPDKKVHEEIRRLMALEHERILQTLCDQLALKFTHTPKPRDVIVALEATGLKFNRPFREAVTKRLLSQNAHKWAEAAATEKKIRLSLTEGERAMWETLQRNYNMNSDALASMLLRIFTVVTRTGKVDHMEVPYLASSMTDKDLKKYAETLNFTVNKSRRTRV
jgi:hypothetical protein